MSFIRTSPDETSVSEVRFQASLRFVLDKVALGQVLLRALLCSSVSVIIPTLCTRLLLNTTVVRKATRQSLGTNTQSNALSDIGDHFTQK